MSFIQVVIVVHHIATEEKQEVSDIVGDTSVVSAKSAH